jgi:hypothetical protein
MRRHKSRSFGIVFAGAFILALIAAQVALTYNSEETVSNVKVTGKERITVGSGEGTSSKYLIFTNREVFENTDTILFLKFNSSDVYGAIQPDQTCEFRVVGWRVPFLSMYRNIISASCEKTQ